MAAGQPRLMHTVANRFRPSTRGWPPAREPAQRDLDPAPDEPQNAIDFARPDAEPRHQLLTRRAQHDLARAMKIARGCRAMHAIENRQLVDAQTVDHVLTEECLFAIRQAANRFAEGLFEFIDIVRLHVAQIRVSVGDEALQLRLLVDRDFFARLAHHRERLADRHDARPASKVAAAAEVLDPGRPSIAHEGALADALLHFHGEVSAAAISRYHSLQALHAMALERLEGVPVPKRTR